MAEIKQEESQQELFREFSGETVKPERFPTIPKIQKPVLLNTSVEQLILAFILAILAFCLMFFLGVLRGRALATRSSSVQRPVQALPSVSQKKPAVSEPVISKPAETVVASADLSKPYTIVLATYKKQSLADREARLIEKSGAQVFVAGSGDYFMVCVGRYANSSEAKKDLKFFGGKYKGCYLKRR